MFKNIKNWIQFWIGFILVLLVSSMTYAAYNALTTVTASDQLLASEWNKMIDNQNDFDTRLNNISSNTIWTWSFVRIEANAIVWSSATSTWTATNSCPTWYTIINWWAVNSVQYWWGWMSHWYASCNKSWNWVQASLYTQNWYTWHWYRCFGLCLKD